MLIRRLVCDQDLDSRVRLGGLGELAFLARGLPLDDEPKPLVLGLPEGPENLIYGLSLAHEAARHEQAHRAIVNSSRLDGDQLRVGAPDDVRAVDAHLAVALLLAAMHRVDGVERTLRAIDVIF